MLYITQNTLLKSREYEVTDEYRRHVWTVKGSLLSGNLVKVYTNGGTLAAEIEKKSGMLGTKFQISVNGVPFETLKKKNIATGVKYEMTKSGWKLEGDYFKSEYRLLTARDGVVMIHSKKWFSWGETYVVEVSRKEDELMCLCVALCIDSSSEVSASLAKK